MHPPANRFHPTLIALHWLMLALLVAVYACIEGREFFPRGSAPREALKTWHFMLGLSVFGLAWLRLALRTLHGVPAIEPPIPAWQNTLSRIVHAALYLVMIGMPLGGWIILSAAGKPIPFFGFELPPLVAPDRALAKTVEGIHVTIGNAAMFLIGLHTVAALYHHYIAHDDTLLRMMPGHARRR